MLVIMSKSQNTKTFLQKLLVVKKNIEILPETYAIKDQVNQIGIMKTL